MRIALVAPPWYRVPPRDYGGTERVVSLLAEGLVERGHDVSLFATGDSVTAAALSAVYPKPIPSDVPFWSQGLRHVQEAFRQAHKFDLIHNHTAQGFLFSPFVETPTLHTIHALGDHAGHRPFYTLYPGRSLVTISRSQQHLLRHPEEIWVVYNGVDTEQFPLGNSKGDYLLHLGRISQRKGTHLAVEVAARVGFKLVIAGKIEDANYFRRAIAPNIDGDRVRFIGPVGGERKVALLQGARALLFPVLWEEPFGLVLIEAMSCGTPVICLNRGSVPEIVVDGLSGFISADVEGMCSAVRKLDGISPVSCRQQVDYRFSAPAMVSHYEQIYRQLVA